MTSDLPTEPWLSFISELDSQLAEPADFHCIGGFTVSQLYGLQRETMDLDFLRVIPGKVGQRVVELAGRGSSLHRKHHVYVDHVTRLAIRNGIRTLSHWPNSNLASDHAQYVDRHMLALKLQKNLPLIHRPSHQIKEQHITNRKQQ